MKGLTLINVPWSSSMVYPFQIWYIPGSRKYHSFLSSGSGRNFKKGFRIIFFSFKNPIFELSSRTKYIPVNVIVNVIINVQPHCNGHFCCRRELASPAAEVWCYWDDLCSRFLIRELTSSVKCLSNYFLLF